MNIYQGEAVLMEQIVSTIQILFATGDSWNIDLDTEYLDDFIDEFTSSEGMLWFEADGNPIILDTTYIIGMRVL